MIQPKVLIVDDKPQNLFTLEKILQKIDVDIIQATNGVDALSLSLEHDFCMAIVDVQMPEMDGYELVSLLRSNENTAALPIIFVSAIHSDEYHHRKGYDAGAVDFMSKPFVPEILLSKVRVFIELYNQRHKLEILVKQLHTSNRMLEKRSKQMETSRRVGHQITSILDLDMLLEIVVSLIHDQFEHYFTGIWLWDESKTHLCLQTGIGGDNEACLSPNTIIESTSKSPIIVTTQTGKMQRCSLNHEQALAHSPTQFTLMMPLQVGHIKVGVLDNRSVNQHAFDEKDIAVIQILADQIAIAIRNAQLYKQVRYFNEQLETKVQERTQELKEAYHSLEILDQNKSDFIEVVAHELRTPLSLIRGYSGMLLNEPSLQQNETNQAMLSGIATGAKRMHEVVNTMLEMIKIDNNTLKLVPETLSLHTLFVELQQKLEDFLEQRTLQLTLQDLQTLPNIEADPDALHKLFYQLLINAVKYTPDGGHITINGRFPTTAYPPLADKGVEIIVKDSGIGIDPAHLEMIFTKFYQTGKVSLHSSGKATFKGGGPGLGLAIAKGIAQAHNGTIWASSPGYNETTLPGTTFHVILPLSQTKT